MGSIFGGSKSSQKSASSNQAYPQINNWAQDLLGYANQGASAASNFLNGDQSGFNQYKQATGFNSLLDQGSRGITNGGAAGGLLRSGSTDKALAKYGDTMQNQYASDYLNQLGNLAGYGYNAANTLSGAGQQSSSSGSSSSKGGIGGFLGSLAGGIAASDRRLKRDIEKVGKNRDGLNVYTYYYKDNPFVKQRGVMADEVAKIKPEALGPVINGYATVDYSKLEI